MQKHPPSCKCRGTGFIKCPDCKGTGKIKLAVNGEIITCFNCSSFYHEVACQVEYPQNETVPPGNSDPPPGGSNGYGFLILLIPVAIIATLLLLFYLFAKGC